MPELTQEMMFALISEPGGDTYRPMWEAVTTAPDYDPYSDEIERLEAMLEQGQFEKTLEVGRPTFRKCFLSPRVHIVAATCYRALGDDDSRQSEWALAAACTHGILGTGDGSLERPYLVTRTSDEYDVLMFLGKSFESQALLHADERMIDRMNCADGTTLHFDVTRPYTTMTRRRRGR